MPDDLDNPRCRERGLECDACVEDPDNAPCADTPEVDFDDDTCADDELDEGDY